MSLFLDDGDVQLWHGDALTVLQGLPAESVHCCVTSPPFYGLRDYGTGRWDGGDPGCDHVQTVMKPSAKSTLEDHGEDGRSPYLDSLAGIPFKDVCGKCGARRVDQQIGLEATPEAWVDSLVRVFREVRRVLRAEGTLWLEVGDSYTAGGGSSNGLGKSGLKRNVRDEESRQRCLADNKVYRAERTPGLSTGVKPKDLIGAPWMLAFALRADGWWLRSDIVWARPNPMPESVTDRPTKAHSYVFLLAKQPKYFFDQEAVREPHAEPTGSGGWQSMARRGESGWHAKYPKKKVDESRNDGESANAYLYGAGRNVRSVWNIATQPYPEAHFATFPEELARRCILAGTSERGCCPECGAPWVREVEASAEYRARLTEQPYKDEWDLDAFAYYLQERRQARGLTSSQVDVGIGTNGAFAWWERANLKREQTGQFRVPTWSNYERLKEVLALDDRFDEPLKRYRHRIEGVWPGSPEWGVKRAPPAAVSAPVTLGWLPSCECLRGADRSLPASAHDPVPCTILDPFVGSGTVPHVARKHGRHAIGIDLNASYLELAARRLQQLSLFAQTAP